MNIMGQEDGVLKRMPLSGGKNLITIDEVMQALKQVVDPEIGLNVVDLNMIKKVNIDDKKIEVRMVLTTPFCPLAGFLVEEVKKNIRAIAEGREVDVVVLDEPWIPPERFRGEKYPDEPGPEIHAQGLGMN